MREAGGCRRVRHWRNLHCRPGFWRRCCSARTALGKNCRTLSEFGGSAARSTRETVWQRGRPVTAQALLAGGVGIAACIDDLRRRQISNWIPGSALAERADVADCAAWLAGRGLGTARHAGWRGGVSDFLFAGRHGRRRRQVDGGVRRAARSETALRSCFVDGRMRRGNGGGRNRRRHGSGSLGAQKIIGAAKLPGSRGRPAERGQHPVRSSDRGRSLVEFSGTT